MICASIFVSIFIFLEAHNNDIKVLGQSGVSFSDLINTDFKKLVTQKERFVDKSMLIKHVMNDKSTAILITRPNRFGKTTSLSMLKYFLSINESTGANLFQNLEINKEATICRTHQNKHPVINITFTDIRQKTLRKVQYAFKTLIGKLYTEHSYLLTGDLLNKGEKEHFENIMAVKSSETEVENGLLKLTEYVRRAHNKTVILLVDDYDTPIEIGFLNNFKEPVQKQVETILRKAIENNVHLLKAVLAGKSLIIPDNVVVHTVLNDDEYSTLFGFTEREVKNLPKAMNKKETYAEIKTWCNGFTWGNTSIFNPWDIIIYIHTSEIKSYSRDEQTVELLKDILVTAGFIIKVNLETLLKNVTIDKTVASYLTYDDSLYIKEDAFWGMLIHTGFLSTAYFEPKTRWTGLRIPNKKEAKSLRHLVQSRLKFPPMTQYFKFVKAMKEGNVTLTARFFSLSITMAGSFFNFLTPTDETYINLITGLLEGMREDYGILVSSKLENHTERAIILAPRNKKDVGLILGISFPTNITKGPSNNETIIHGMMLQDVANTFQYVGCVTVQLFALEFCNMKINVRSQKVTLEYPKRATILPPTQSEKPLVK